MKINVEIDLTPEELRRFMGLPDVEGLHQQMMDGFLERLQSSNEQREAFMRNLFTGAVAPWQSFFSMTQPSSDRKSGKSS